MSALSIGEVLSVLQEEFPDVTISKIRFLESQGLVCPERNASGYRQFSDTDVERLTWILRQQRDHFLPLKVIKKALERGGDIHDAGAGDQPTLWSAFADAAAAEEAMAQKAEVWEGDDVGPEPGAGRGFVPPDRPDRPGHDAPGAAGSAGGITAYEASSPRETVTPEATGRSTRSSGGEAVGTQAEGHPDAAGESHPKRRHSTPADVVAALQEDPRHPAGPPGAGGRSHDAGSAVEKPGPGIHPDLAVGRLEEPGEDAMSSPLTREELLDTAGISGALLDGLEQYGLIESIRHAGEPSYGAADLIVARAAAVLADHGVEPRHLRMYKVAAEREAGFIEQLVTPILKQRNPAARERARTLACELSELGARVHAAILTRELPPDLSD